MPAESCSKYRGSRIVTRSVEDHPSANGHRRFKASYSVENESRDRSLGQFFNDVIFDTMENAAGNALKLARLEVDARLESQQPNLQVTTDRSGPT